MEGGSGGCSRIQNQCSNIRSLQFSLVDVVHDGGGIHGGLHLHCQHQEFESVVRDCFEGRRSHGLEAPHVNIPLVFHNLLRLYDSLHVGQWPPVHHLRPHQLAFPMGVFLVTVVGLCLQMYVTVCYLASVVSVLEDKYYGLAAMKKRIQLIKGKQTMALALIILHDIFAAAIGELFVYSVVDGRSHGVGITTRALYGLLLIGLLCFVNLMVMLTECLLCFVCKSYHHENIDNNSLFKVYKSRTMSL